MAKSKSFSAGDRVAYSAAFLKSTGQRGIVPTLRGTVLKVEPLGVVQLVTIEWDNYHAPSQYHEDGLGRVIAPNLTLISRLGADSALST